MPDYSPIRYEMFGGVNSADAENQIGDNEVVDAVNFLFEREECFTRPGLSAPSALSISGNGVFAKSTRLNANGSLVTLLISSNGHLFRLTPGYSVVDLGAITTGATDFHNIAAVNNVMLVGNTPNGLVRVDPATNGVTTIATAKFRYVRSLLSRAVGAYDTTASFGSIKVGWTVAGDETTWTGATNGSGSAILSDAPDEITGCETIKNVWVILRRGGIHLGYQTGLGFPAFRFEQYQRDGAGCNFPSTVACEDNMIFFCSNDDVFTFDLQGGLQRIGGKIRYELFNYLDNGVLFRGFMSRSTSSTTLARRPRLRYNLFPTQAGYTHFSYDLDEKKWSRHQYNATSLNASSAFYYIQNNNFESPAIFDSAGNIYTWDNGLNCESAAYMLGKMFDVQPLEKDYRVNRILLKHRNMGETDGITLGVSASLNNVRTWKTDVQNIGTQEADFAWMRTWFNIDSVGNDFQVRIDVPPNTPFSTNYLSMQLSEAGEYKGARPKPLDPPPA